MSACSKQNIPMTHRLPRQNQALGQKRKNKTKKRMRDAERSLTGIKSFFFRRITSPTWISFHLAILNLNIKNKDSLLFSQKLLARDLELSLQEAKDSGKTCKSWGKISPEVQPFNDITTLSGCENRVVLWKNHEVPTLTCSLHPTAGHEGLMAATWSMWQGGTCHHLLLLLMPCAPRSPVLSQPCGPFTSFLSSRSQVAPGQGHVTAPTWAAWNLPPL